MAAADVLGKLLGVAAAVGASEIHLQLPSMPGVEGNSAFRVRGIITDIDPELERLIGEHEAEIRRLIYEVALSETSALLRDRVMLGRILPEGDIPLPDGMEGVDVLMLPSTFDGTHIVMRPRPMPMPGTTKDSCWDEASEAIAMTVTRPSRGLTVFLSPDLDVAAALMQDAARRASENRDSRFMVFDRFPWPSNWNVGVSEIPFKAVAAAAIAAADYGTDVIVLGDLHDVPNNIQTVERLVSAGTHVWVRARGPVDVGLRELGLSLGLTRAPWNVVRAVRVSMVDQDDHMLVDPEAIEWLNSNKVPITKGCLQRSPSAAFPSGMLLADVFSLGDSEDRRNALPRLAATLVDRGILCGVDASRKLAMGGSTVYLTGERDSRRVG